MRITQYFQRPQSKNKIDPACQMQGSNQSVSDLKQQFFIFMLNHLVRNQSARLPTHCAIQAGARAILGFAGMIDGGPGLIKVATRRACDGSAFLLRAIAWVVWVGESFQKARLIAIF